MGGEDLPPDGPESTDDEPKELTEAELRFAKRHIGEEKLKESKSRHESSQIDNPTSRHPSNHEIGEPSPLPNPEGRPKLFIVPDNDDESE